MRQKSVRLAPASVSARCRLSIQMRGEESTCAATRLHATSGVVGVRLKSDTGEHNRVAPPNIRATSRIPLPALYCKRAVFVTYCLVIACETSCRQQ
jgi:hypothetical protein